MRDGFHDIGRHQNRVRRCHEGVVPVHVQVSDPVGAQRQAKDVIGTDADRGRSDGAGRDRIVPDGGNA